MQDGTAQQIMRSLDRIAACMESNERRMRQRESGVDPQDLGALALWRSEVFAGRTLLGFPEWLAWHESDKAEVEKAQTS